MTSAQSDIPQEVATHSTEQVFYFDKEGLLRRQDYNVGVLGGAPLVNYASEHKEFSGLVLQPAAESIGAGLTVSLS
jgi:hypothetical protein